MRNLLLLMFCGALGCFQSVSVEGAEQKMAEDHWSIAVNANNQFAVDLFRSLSQGDENVLVSPYSISSALGMTFAGAEGATKEQMSKVMHFTLLGYEKAAAALNQEINAEQIKDLPFALLSANAVWLSDRIEIKEAFANTVKMVGGSLHKADYSVPEEVREEINGWVEEKTRERIKDLLPPNSLTADTLLTLVNALYMKAPWQFPFKNVFEGDFYLDGEKSIQNSMVQRQGSYVLQQGDTYDVVEIPYKSDPKGGAQLVMRIYLPHENDGLAGLKEQLLSGDHSPAGLTFDGKARLVDLTIPKFRIEDGVQLKRVLMELGMDLAFGDHADFSGMTDDQPGPKIGEVYHKTFMEVDENGTEAAAATAVVMVTRSAAVPTEKPFVFRADHPFVFNIVDKKTGTILFIGQLTDPQ